MSKGFFTQGVCVLLEQTVSLEQIESALADFEVVGRNEAGESWVFSGPSVTVSYRPEVNGYVAIDIIDRPWPDHLGDPKEEPTVFGGWSMGHLGPYAYPGGLGRAAGQCWRWEEGKTAPERHEAFIRVRSSYVFGAEDDKKIMPEDYAAFPELEFVTQIAGALLRLPGVLCYFNPNGEVLRDQAGLADALEFSRENDLPPLDVWSNVRLFTLDEDWSAMDVVGSWQLDIPDSEACFQNSGYELGEMANFLRNVTLYLLNHGDVFKDGDTMDGPGEVRWQVNHEEDALSVPPREVLRWMPMDGSEVPPELLEPSA